MCSSYLYTAVNGELTVEFRQPFDMIADVATECASKKAAGMATSDLCQAKLPVNNFSNKCSLVESRRKS